MLNLIIVFVLAKLMGLALANLLVLILLMIYIFMRGLYLRVLG